MASQQLEQVLDPTLEQFFNSNPGLDKYYSIFKHDTFSGFKSLSVQQLSDRIGHHVPNIDEIIGRIVKSRSEYSNTFDDLDESETLSAEQISTDILASSSANVTNGIVQRRIYLKVVPMIILKSCIITNSQLCMNCTFNQENDITEKMPMLCERLMIRSKSSAAQIRPFPIAEFKLIVNDGNLRNRLEDRGIKCVIVRKEVGTILFDYLRSIFP